jgi:hypothetical protein
VFAVELDLEGHDRHSSIRRSAYQGIAADAVRASCASRPVPALGGILRAQRG